MSTSFGHEHHFSRPFFTEFCRRSGRLWGFAALTRRTLLKREAGLEKLTGRSWPGSNKIRGSWGRSSAPWCVCGGGDEKMEMGTEVRDGEGRLPLPGQQHSRLPVPSPAFCFHQLPCSVSCAPSWPQIALMSMWRNGSTARHQSVIQSVQRANLTPPASRRRDAVAAGWD